MSDERAAEQGWELLSRKAFLEDSVHKRNCLQDFEKLGKEIVRKCGGFPLAIVVLGGLLANKSAQEWEAVQKDINKQFIKLQIQSQYAGVNWILALSYQCLPFRQKPCFLYLSQFPEDGEIHKRELIRMWIAEGFKPQGERDETMEDVGEQYLEELVSRCMVQVSQRDHTGIGIKTFRMHDLMRDMCISKTNEEKFFRLVDGSAGSDSSAIVPSPRRVVAHAHIPFLPTKENGQRLHTLIYTSANVRLEIPKHQVIRISQNLKLLRVLKLERVYLKSKYVPENIGNLVHLRYLGLKDTGLHRSHMCLCFPTSAWPACIGNLKCLHTLDLRMNQGRIPDVLWKLECLRHLLLGQSYKGNLRLNTLRNLESLKWVKAKDLIRNDGMLKLTNLRHLAIQFRTPEEAKKVLKSPILELGLLRTLKMEISCIFSFPNSEQLSSCHHLTKLKLYGSILEDPQNRSQNLNFLPANLTKLTLSYSKLMQDPMVILEKLPNLKWLWLTHHAYIGSKMVCSAHCFPQLEFLKLQELSEVEEWEIEEGAMPCLKSLCINWLLKLGVIPEGLKSVISLQNLTIECTAEYKRRVEVINGLEGEDFYKVKHIPSITVTARW